MHCAVVFSRNSEEGTMMENPSVLMGLYGRIAQDARVVRAAQALSSSYKITVIALKPHSGAYTGILHVIELPTRTLDKIPVLRLTWFWVRFIFLAVRRRPDIVYAHDFYMVFPGMLAATLIKAKFVYDAHELIIATRKNRTGLRYRLFCLLERLSLPAADLVIAANRYRARLMKKYYGMKSPPVPVLNIPSVGQTQASPDVEREYSSLKVDGRSVIVYEGNMASSRGIHLLVNAMPLLRDDCMMVLIGSGSGAEQIRENVKKRGLENDVFCLGTVPHSSLHSILALCHIGLVTYSFSGLNNIYCAPNKLFEYAHAGLPILSSGQRVLRQMVRGYDIGECLSPKELMQPERIAEKTRRILRNRDHHIANLSNFLRDCSWEKESARLRSSIKGLLLSRNIQ